MSLSLFLLAQALRFFMARQVAFKLGRARVVRVGSQLLLTEGGQCVQSVRVLFHGARMASGRGTGIKQLTGVFA
ncbi:MAG: hypothetical protein QNJ84_11800 [Alphaproteobacteria bacterium]|nr:hypothetical protein [Alphaproteobacteria bacterium]